MKRSQITLFSLVCASLMLSFSSCLSDKCVEDYTYKVFTPVYISVEEMRNGVKITEPTAMVNPGKIYYRAPYLFVNEVNKGIHIFDNSNPYAPQNISFISIPGNADIAIKGNTLYADSYIDLLSFDISDPQNIMQTSRLTDVFPNRTYFNGWAADPALGIVADWIESDTTITTTCSSSWSGWNGGVFFASQFDGSSVESSGTNNNTPTGTDIAGSTAQFAVVNNYLYCLTDDAMQLFNLTSPATPQPAGEVSMGWNIETIFPYNDYLFVGSTTGIQIYDNSNPTAPYFITNFSHYNSCDPVVVQDNYAYSTLRSGTMCDGFTNQLDIIDISNIINPVLVKSYDMTNPYGLGIDGNNLFICDGPTELKMYDVADVNNISLLMSVNITDPMDVICTEGLLIVTASAGIFQYGYGNGSLVPYGSIPVQQP